MGCCFGKTSIKELPVPLPSDFFRIETAAERKEFIAVVARAFAGTADCTPEGGYDWTLGPQLKDRWDDPRRMIYMKWVVAVNVGMALECGGAFAIGARSDNGDLAAALLVKPVLDEKTACTDVCDTCALYNQLLCRVGPPPVWKLGGASKGIVKRLLALDGFVTSMREKYAKVCHLDVLQLAVDPGKQGKGLGSKLLQFVSMLADHYSAACWLDTDGQRNRAFYERFGYQMMEQYSLKCDGDPDNSPPHDDAYAMLRPIQQGST